MSEGGRTSGKNSSGEFDIKRIDTRGMVCPYPSFEAVRALSAALPGELIEILTDNEESALKSVPTVLGVRNVKCLVEAKEGYWVIRFSK